MYASYETPEIDATLFYYDIEYDHKTSEQVLNILEKYKMYPPKKIYAGKMTKNKYVCSGDNARGIFIAAYSEKDVLGVGMIGKEDNGDDEYWEVDWDFTFYKESKNFPIGTFKPWNVLSISSTYGRLNNSDVYDNFISCFKELIEVIEPFYASIDDVANAVRQQDRAHETCFVPERIQTIYWGNYFGKSHCEKYGINKMNDIPAAHVEQIGEGIFFTLSDSVFDFDSKETRNMRKKIKKYLKKQ